MGNSISLESKFKQNDRYKILHVSWQHMVQENFSNNITAKNRITVKSDFHLIRIMMEKC